MFLVMVVVIPQVNSLALAFLVVPLNLGLEVWVLACLAVLVARYGVLVVASFVAILPGLLFGHSTVFVVFAVSMAVVMASCRAQITIGCGR